VNGRTGWCLVGALLAAVVIGSAQAGWIEPLTSNGWHDTIGRVSDQRVVWSDAEGLAGEPIRLFSYKADEGKRLIASYDTTESHLYPNPYSSPKVSGDDHILWTALVAEPPDVDPHERVFHYDALTDTITQITSGSNPQVTSEDDLYPSFSNGNMAWSGAVEQGGEVQQQVFFRDGATGDITQLTNEPYGTRFVCLSGSNLAWTADLWDKTAAFFYDGSTAINVSDPTSLGDNVVCLDGQRAVWNGVVGTNVHVFYYDHTTGATIDLSALSGYPGVLTLTGPGPEVSGPYAVWRTYVGADSQIVLANLTDPSDPTFSLITTGGASRHDPRIAGSFVVWTEQSDPDDDYELWLYDILSDSLEQVTDNSWDDFFPEVSSNGHVAWEAYTKGWGPSQEQWDATEIWHGMWEGPSRGGPWRTIPEPGTMALLAGGLCVVLLRRRARRP